jgi:hypothetical protein
MLLQPISLSRREMKKVQVRAKVVNEGDESVTKS